MAVAINEVMDDHDVWVIEPCDSLRLFEESLPDFPIGSEGTRKFLDSHQAVQVPMPSPEHNTHRPAT